MIVIGITGIIGSGKSTVAALLERQGLPVIDIDRLGKEVTNREDVIREVRESIGEAYIRDNLVDVEKLRQSAFESIQLLKRLEKIIHPKVSAEVWRRISSVEKEGTKLVLVDHPLLFETDFYKKCQKVVVVSAETEQIMERLKERGMAIDDAERRTALQIPLSEKEARADHVVHNNGTREDLEKEAATLLERIKGWEVEAHAS